MVGGGGGGGRREERAVGSPETEVVYGTVSPGVETRPEFVLLCRRRSGRRREGRSQRERTHAATGTTRLRFSENFLGFPCRFVFFDLDLLLSYSREISHPSHVHSSSSQLYLIPFATFPYPPRFLNLAGDGDGLWRWDVLKHEY